jgi:DNA polymerase I-like protein with 3'-5' exonuclease and polymerase domains
VAVNTPIQGSAADIVKLAMLRVHRALRAELPNVKLLLQVHDELLLEAPERDVEAARALLAREMEAGTAALVAATAVSPLKSADLVVPVQRVEDSCKACHEEFRAY